MAVSNSYLEYILERLATVGSVTARRMFGGVGIYTGATFFALIDDDTLYFKVDNRNRPEFEAEGMTPFRPFGEDSYAMKYYSVPEHVIEDDQLLREWTVRALAAATKRKAGKKK